MRISDWSSDVCSSDLISLAFPDRAPRHLGSRPADADAGRHQTRRAGHAGAGGDEQDGDHVHPGPRDRQAAVRSEEHTSELQSLMRISYAVFCLKKKKTTDHTQNNQVNSKHKHDKLQITRN